MKKKHFKYLLTSIDQVRKIHAAKMKLGRIYKFNPIIVINKGAPKLIHKYMIPSAVFKVAFAKPDLY